MPNLTTHGGWGAGRTECVQQVTCVCVCVCCGGQWRPRGPGSWLRPELYLTTEERAGGFVGVEQRLAASRSPLFLSIQGHCWGPEDQLSTEACQRSRRPHGPSGKTYRASPRGMYKLTRWVYPVNVTSVWLFVNLNLCRLTYFGDFKIETNFREVSLGTWSKAVVCL